MVPRVARLSLTIPCMIPPPGGGIVVNIPAAPGHVAQVSCRRPPHTTPTRQNTAGIARRAALRCPVPFVLTNRRILASIAIVMRNLNKKLK